MKKLIDIFFPKKCINCQKEGSYLCEDCLSLIDVNPFIYCLCDKMEKIHKCEKCKHRYLDRIYSACSFKNSIVQNAIHKLKYSYIKELSIPLSFLIIKHLQEVSCLIDEDFVIIPIPLSNKRKRARGFNQSEEIAKIISETTGLKLFTDCIEKIKNNKAQVELNKEERLKNISGVYKVKKDILGLNIILIDDVYTTGATMEECAKILKEKGANSVWGVTVAREIVDL
ncbi:MAG: ComF family protein [Candidatus Pacebacteria bacterium]|nr:ComF family protein [Candidatus Paceibacterota bacterium]